MEKSKKIGHIIIYATATSWIFQAVSAISGLIVLPLVVAYLGKTEYGIWTLVIQTINFLAMSDMGVSNALGRFVARSRGLNDKDAMSKLYSTTIAFLLLSGLFIALITILLTPWVGDILGIEKTYYKVTEIVFIITGLSLALQSPFKLSVGVLTGHQLYGPHGIGKILGSVLNLLGVLILYSINMIELIPLAIMNAISILISQIVLVVVSWRITGPWSLDPRKISLKLMIDILSLGGSTLVFTLSNLIYRSGLIIAVGRILGVQAAGVYGVVLTLISHIYPLISSFSTPFTTLASEWQARDRLQDLRNISNIVMRSIFTLSSCVAAGLFIYGEPILRLLFSSGNWSPLDFHKAGNMLFIMGLGMTLGLPQIVSVKALQGIGKHWQVSYGSLAISILSLIIGISIMNTDLDIYGAAWGWSLFWGLQGILFPAMTSRYLSLSLWEMLIKTYLPGIGVGLFVLSIAWFFDNWLVASNLLNLLIGIGICSFVGGMAVLIISGYNSILWNRIINWLS